MKTIVVVLLSIGFLFNAKAQRSYQVEAFLVTHPAGMTLAAEKWERGEIQKEQGVQVLKLQKGQQREGVLVSCKATEVTSLPGGGSPREAANWNRKIETGWEFQLQIDQPREEAKVVGSLTLREKGKAEGREDFAIVPMTVREFYWGGTTQSGQTLVMPLQTTQDGKSLTLVMKITKDRN